MSSQKKTSKSFFTHDEDDTLRALVAKYGEDWEKISSIMTSRNVRQVRDRWINFLSPLVVKNKWSREEDLLLIEKYTEFGPCWKQLQQFFPGRTNYNIRNHWKSVSRMNMLDQIPFNTYSPPAAKQYVIPTITVPTEVKHEEPPQEKFEFVPFDFKEIETKSESGIIEYFDEFIFDSIYDCDCTFDF